MGYCISFLTVLIVYPFLPLTNSFELDVLAIWISQIFAQYLFIIPVPFYLIELMHEIPVPSLPRRVCHSISTNLFYFLLSIQHHPKSFAISSHWDISFNTETWKMNKYISLLFIKFKENRKITSVPCQQWFCYISSTRVALRACSVNTCFSRAAFFFFSFSSSHQTHLRAVLQRVQGPGLAGISEQKGHQGSGGRRIPTPRHDGLLPPLHRPTHLC